MTDNQNPPMDTDSESGPKIEVRAEGDNIKIGKSGGGQPIKNLKMKKAGGDAGVSVEGDVIKVDLKNQPQQPALSAPTDEKEKAHGTDAPTTQEPEKKAPKETDQPTSAENNKDDEDVEPDSTPTETGEKPTSKSKKSPTASTEQSDGEATDPTSGQPKETDSQELGAKSEEENKSEEDDGDDSEDNGEKNKTGEKPEDGKEEPENKPLEPETNAKKPDELDDEKPTDKEMSGQPDGSTVAKPKQDEKGQPNTTSPQQLSPNTQKNTASQLNQERQANKGGKILNFPQQMANRAKKGIKNTAENLDPRSIANSISLDRERLKREIKKLHKELKEAVGDKADKILLSKGLGLLGWILPGVANDLREAMDFGKNTASEYTVIKLKAKVIKLKVIIDTLKAAEGVTTIVDATKFYFQLLRNIIGMIPFPFSLLVGTIAIILIPMTYPTVLIWFLFFHGSITKAIDDVIKQIEEILKPLEEKLEKEKNILFLRRRIRQKENELNRTSLLSVSRDNNQPADNKQQKNNDEQTPYKKAA